MVATCWFLPCFSHGRDDDDGRVAVVRRKTNTASVLHEALDYTNFLHDQVKVLSAPYIHYNPSK
ncbi:hypothetical protein R6Q59_016225 [Mikania micrantha]